MVLRNTGCAFWFAVSLVACSGGMDPLAASSPLDRSFASVPSIVRTVSANGTTHLVRSRWCFSGCERASQSAAVCATARHLWQSHAVAALAAPFWRVTVASHGCTILWRDYVSQLCNSCFRDLRDLVFWHTIMLLPQKAKMSSIASGVCARLQAPAPPHPPGRAGARGLK